MEDHFSQLVKRSRLAYSLRNWLTRRRDAAALLAWEDSGRPIPPPHIVKQRVLLKAAQQHKLSVLIETGTFYGDMVEAMRRRFERIYTIELSDTLYAAAKRRFKYHSHITIIHGDSGTELKKLLPSLEKPALFWLDGHYSGGQTARGALDTPVLQELAHIFNAPDLGHVILIDDARLFGKDPGYPSLDQLSEFVRWNRPDLRIEVADDIIRITPAGAA